VRALPTGTVTFLFSDIEGSTRLLDELGPERYPDALAEHRRMMLEAFGAAGGVEVTRDAFVVGFPEAAAALAAAARAQERLARGPVRVRHECWGTKHSRIPLGTGVLSSWRTPLNMRSRP
jgi:class 3 adenylate cyclase